MNGNEYGWLDSYGNGYKPEHSFQTGLDTLADGPYDFEILKAELGSTSTQKSIIALELRVNGGMVVKHNYWLDSGEINDFGADCTVLGLDASRWGTGANKIPLSQAIPDALKKLAGIKFRGQKTSNTPKEGKHAGKTFHKLHVNSRIGGQPMPSPATSPNMPTSAPIPAGAGTPF